MIKKLLVVDDHPLFREGISRVITQEDDLEICGEAGTVAEALEKTEALKPDLVILDLTLQKESGLDLLKTLSAQYEKLPVLVLSMHDESLYAERVLKAGARGYVMKQEANSEIMKAVRRILSGRIYVSDAISEKMLEKQVRGLAPNESSVNTLSDREMQVFQMIGDGVTTAEIAKNLHLSVKTVETYRANIKEKLRLGNNTDLIRHAMEWVRTGGDL